MARAPSMCSNGVAVTLVGCFFRVFVGACMSLALVMCEPYPGTGGSSSSGGGSGEGGTSLLSIDAQKLCTRLIGECKQAITNPECVKRFGVLRITPRCGALIDGASCADLGSTTSTVTATCFPPCSGQLARCNGDGTITLCTADGKQETVDCAASCISDGYASWTGECGTTYQGQAAAQAQCWCR